MNDPRYNKLAKLLVNYSVEVKPKDLVAITGLTPAVPLVKELFREILLAGGFPYFLVRGYPPYFPGLENPINEKISLANQDQLEHVDIFYKKVIDEFDVLISILSRSNTQSSANIDLHKVGVASRAHKEVTHTYFERKAAGELRRVLTIFPTQGYAQDAEMNLDELEEYLFRTSFCDGDDPVQEWRRISAEQRRIADYLTGKKTVIIQGPDVDLTMSIEGRRFLDSSGKENMPDGEIFTGPVEESVTGWIHFTYPDYGPGGAIKDIELEFVNGRVEKATASENENFLLELLDRDPGARYIGELGIGTNQRVDQFTRNMLFDEKIFGTIHLALGHGYPESGSKNESAIHWDLLCDMKDGGRIFVDDELVYEEGKFLIK